MRHAQALLPYAVTALLVVVTSAAALGLAVADVRDARDAAVDRAAATATAVPRTFPELSRASRLAYWRTDPSGGAELTVSNVDGTLRRTLARAEAVRRISLTRWTPDGNAIAYVDNGVALVVAKLDGTRTELALPDDVRTQGGGRIVDHRWSPDSEQIAASVVRADLRSDVFFAKIGERTWTRATTLEDAFTADWIAGDVVLVHTGGGVLGTIKTGSATNGIRPLTGLTATSPILADDGRIHFLNGAVSSTPRDITLPYLTASGATVWSMSLDGSDLRRETNNVMDDVRLDGRYGQGRYLAHRGSSQLQVLLSEGVNIPAIDAGPVERAIVAPDGRSAIGFSANRIIRFDLVRGAALGTFGSPSVMLDSVAGGDVWYPRATPAAAVPVPRAGGPAARYAFNLGGHLWSMGPDGVGSFLRARTSLAGRRNVLPAWSPDGDRLLAIQLAGQGLAGVTAATPVAVTIDRAGSVRPYAESRAATAIPSWSPAGDAFAVVVDRRGVDATSSQADLEVRFVSVDGGLVREAVPGREVVWTRSGVLVLTPVSVDIVEGGTRRTLVELPRILGDARGEFPADRTSTSFANLSSSPDGAYAAVRVGVTPRVGANRFTVVLVRVADGAITAFLNGSTAQDLGWSPAGRRLGLTQTAEVGTQAQLRDAATGQVIATQPGRFAGWSPDGEWSYVARGEGLFAYQGGGGDGVRVSGIGVPVMTTAP